MNRPTCGRIASAFRAFPILVVSLVLLAACGETTGPSIAALGITSDSIGSAVQNAAYSEKVEAMGGEQPYAWTISAGALPVGLALNASSGVISGSPSAAGPSDFTVQVTSADGQSSTKAFSIEVFAPLEISTTTLPVGLAGAAYDATLAASGADGSYSWSLVAGVLQSGLALSANTGGISGTPTSPASRALSFRVTSGDGQMASVDVTLDVYGELSIATASLPSAVKDAAYSDTLSADGGDGAYSWSITTGSLPAGLTLDSATGVISGTPTAVESQTFTVAVESGDEQTADVELTLSAFDAVAISTTSLAPALENVAYADTLEATGGDGAYTWSLLSGVLPSALTLDASTGVISGMPTVLGAPVLTLRVESADGQSAQVDLTLGVYAELTISTTSLRSGIQNSEYADTLTIAGGDGTATWSITAGGLPAGLTFDPSSGAISGTPTATETQMFTVEAHSGDGQVAETDLSIGVYPLLQVTTASLATATQAFAYEDTLDASGGDGSYSWSISAGTLPGGLSLDPAAGLISGTSTTLQTADLTFQVESGDGQTAEADLSLAIEAYVMLPTESCADYEPESIVTFEDDKLAVDIRVELAVPVGVGLTCDRAADLTWLPASGDTIESLAGIQNLVSLTHLWLDQNSLGELTPLAGLTDLEWLSLSSAGITDIGPLSGLTKLDFLELSQNSITDVTALSGMSVLTRLIVQSNQISDVTPLSGLASIDQIWLSENSVSDVTPLAGLTTLTDLSLYDNPVTDISSLSGLTGLLNLNLGRTSIGDLSVISAFTALESLNLGISGVTDISFLSGLTSLNVLGLAYNQVSDLSPLAGLTQLTQLGLYQNLVTDITPLAGLTSLGELFLGRNSITDVSGLSGLTALTRLDLRENTITDVTAVGGLTQLSQLLLDDNAGLSDIDPLLNAPWMGAGVSVWLTGTAVSCTDANALVALGATVYASCP